MGDSFESPLTVSYLTGVYLVANAVQDVYLVVDGPNCVFFRTAQIQGNHDWHSTLVSCSGIHRVVDTGCTTERAAVGDTRLLISRLEQVDALRDCRLILLTAMSMVVATGRQYEKILRDLEGKIEKPVVLVPSGSLEGDWLLGYSRTLGALAGGIVLDREARRTDDQVAIVGYLMDRNEADHRANLDELRSLLGGLGLDLCSCWLSGGTIDDLAAVSRAGTILSLPYGREAARILARRTGARLLECSLPVGLEGTCAWLREIGKALGREVEAEEVIERELARTVPMLEWILPHSLVGKGVALLGDPYLVAAVASMVSEMGCRVVLGVTSGSRQPEEGQSGHPSDGGTLIINPNRRELSARLRELEEEGSLDLVITNSLGLIMLGNLPGIVSFVELGFPSHHTHALHHEPFMGFNGTLKLVERMSNALSQVEVYRRR